jgi:hypothetical protein
MKSDKEIEVYDLIVVGGGAAGFFGAINAATLNNDFKILILEKSNRLLTKVRISGGGRCNVTHRCFESTRLARHYPRGSTQLKKLFKIYNATHVIEWFEVRGVKLKSEPDGRMFPVTDSSSTIINCFMEEAEQLGIRIKTNQEVLGITNKGNAGYDVLTANRKFSGKKLLVTVGGSSKPSNYAWIARHGLKISSPIPSLFTFNDTQKRFKDLMGLSVANATVKIAGTKFEEKGPVLITHWGLSGPAVIKLSAWAAEYLFKCNYEFQALVNWLGEIKEEQLRILLKGEQDLRKKQLVFGNPLFGLPARLWQRLCTLAEIDSATTWAALPQKNMNRLIEHLVRCPFSIKGKTTFKEEFVTCGGVDLTEIDLSTMQSKLHPGVFFAGEVLNIDGETGGFNFQAAWTTAFIAARNIDKAKNA